MVKGRIQITLKQGKIIMSESRYSVEELKNIYGVTERTLKNWKKNKDFPMLEISSQHKYVYKDDLVKWKNLITITN